MKKIYIISLVFLLLTGLVVAGLTLNIEVNKEDYSRLEKVNSTSISHTAINCNSDKCDVVNIDTGYGHTTWKPEPYWENCLEYNIEQLCSEFKCIERTTDCKTSEKVYYSNSELEEQLNQVKEDLTNRILTRLKINEEISEKDEKVSEGTSEITKK